jgi:hypothetical protein
MSTPRHRHVTPLDIARPTPATSSATISSRRAPASSSAACRLRRWHAAATPPPLRRSFAATRHDASLVMQPMYAADYSLTVSTLLSLDVDVVVDFHAEIPCLQRVRLARRCRQMPPTPAAESPTLFSCR